MNVKVFRRREAILERIEGRGKVFIKDLSEVFGVSMETIRKDFEALSRLEGIERFHGGLKKNNRRIEEYHYYYHHSKSLNIEEKKRIAYKGFQLIEEGEWVYLDGGTTVANLFNHLDLRRGVTFVTPSLILLMRYLVEDLEQIFERNNHRLIFIGGAVNTRIYTTYGVDFNHGIGEFNFDKMYFSVDAIDIKGGLTNSDEIPYGIIQQVRGRAREKILLVDHSKFGGIRQRTALKLEDLDCLITDESLQTPWLRLLKENGIQYIKA
ncbi:MAG: hypothetical protein AVO33_11005 [delta proteobacterium ML8_F1]|nr:MAG: hypothetical protein AVO33_11005 [delta proteobacterium ML8_F1]